MSHPKPLSRIEIQAALNKTRSNMAAARYLNVSFQHYKKYAKLYKDEATGKTLFDLHKNQSGKGIPKFLKGPGKIPAIIDIIEGRIDPSSFDADKIKYKLMSEGYLEEACSCCGFNQRRVVDYKMPLLLNFKDKNKQNYRKENIELLCYNCYFLYYADVFTDKDLKQIEGHRPLYETTENIDFQLDEYHLEKLRDLEALGKSEKVEDDPYDLVSRI